MQLHVPAVGVDALREGLDHLEADDGVGLRVERETDAADATVVKPAEFGVGNVGTDHTDAARALAAELRDGVERHRVVDAMRAGRDDDGARGAELRLHGRVTFDIDVREDVHVRVARIGRRRRSIAAVFALR